MVENLQLANLAAILALKHGNLLEQHLVLLLQTFDLVRQYHRVSRFVRLHVKGNQTLQARRWWFLEHLIWFLVEEGGARLLRSLIVDALEVI